MHRILAPGSAFSAIATAPASVAPPETDEAPLAVAEDAREFLDTVTGDATELFGAAKDGSMAELL